MVWNHTCNFYSKSPWIMQLPNEIQCDLHIPMEKRAKHKQKWNESKVIEKHFYNKASQKRALWLADMLAPFARRLHADAGALGSFFFFFVHEMKDVWQSQCYKRNGQRAASNHRVMVHAGGCYARKKCKSRTRRDNNTEARVDMEFLFKCLTR